MAERRPEDLVRHKQSNIWPIMFVLAAVVLLLVIFFPRTDRAAIGDDAQQPGTAKEQAQAGDPNVLNQQAADMARNVQLSAVQVIPSPAAEAAGAQNVFVQGMAQNNNAETIKGATVEAVFYGEDGSEIARQTKNLQFLEANDISQTSSGHGKAESFVNIAANESIGFRVGFDALPAGWNKKPPELRVTAVFTE